jgi:hypothetical protein
MNVFTPALLFSKLGASGTTLTSTQQSMSGLANASAKLRLCTWGPCYGTRDAQKHFVSLHVTACTPCSAHVPLDVPDNSSAEPTYRVAKGPAGAQQYLTFCRVTTGTHLTQMTTRATLPQLLHGAAGYHQHHARPLDSK